MHSSPPHHPRTVRSDSLRPALLTLAALACFLLASIARAEPTLGEPAPTIVRIGVLAKRGPEVCIARWGPTAEHLSAEIPGYTFEVVPLDFEAIRSAVETHEVAFFLLNSSMYVDLERRLGARRIATMLDPGPDGSIHDHYAGVLFRRADRDEITSIEDIGDLRLAAVNEHSLGGWHAQLGLLLDHGCDPRDAPERLRFVGTHDAVVHAVLEGEADVGAVRSDTLERMAQEGLIQLEDLELVHEVTAQPRQLGYVHSTALYPEWPFAKSPDTSDELARMVAVALMRMEPDSPAARASHCVGWTVPQNYQLVHQLLKDIRVPPYEHYGEVSLGAFSRQYWPWLISLGILAAITLISLIVVARLRARLAITLRQHQRALTLSNRIAYVFLSSPPEEIYRDVLEVLLEALDSTVGLFGYLDEQGDLVCADVTAGVLGEPPSEGPLVIPSGHWSELCDRCLQEGQPQISNRELTIPQSDRTLGCALTAPITHQGEVIGLFLVANRDGCYDEHDRELLEQSAAQTGPILHALLEREQRLREHRALEEQYRQAQKMEAIGQLTGGVAHDFNNLLSVIGFSLELAEDELEEDHLAAGYLADIKGANRRAAALVSRLLMFSRRQVMQPEVLEPNEVIGRLVELVRRVLEESIELSWQPSPGLGSIYADRSMLDQVLLNLCVNARDAMPEGGTLVLSTQQVQLDEAACAGHAEAQPGPYVRITVRDSGEGMEEATRTRIFEPFFTTKGAGKGTGLGLAIVYGVIQQHQGFLELDSAPGEGTEFRLFLPITDVPPGVERKRVPIEELRGSETILLVEDDDKLRDITSGILERAGYRVLTAADGREGVELFEEQHEVIDLVILDVVMPEQDGYAAYQRMRSVEPELVALFASGYSDTAVHQRIDREEDLTLLRKPYSRSTLLRSIRRLLNARSSPDHS